GGGALAQAGRAARPRPSPAALPLRTAFVLLGSKAPAAPGISSAIALTPRAMHPAPRATTGRRHPEAGALLLRFPTVPQPSHAGDVRRVGTAAGRRSAKPHRTANWRQNLFCGWKPPSWPEPRTTPGRHPLRPIRSAACIGKHQEREAHVERLILQMLPRRPLW